MSILAFVAIATEVAILVSDWTTTVAEAQKMAAEGNIEEATKMLEDKMASYKAASDGYRAQVNPNKE